MITKAHYDSRQFILDPVYSIHGKNPEEQILTEAPYWHYGHYECEAFLLLKMIRAKQEAKLKVGYTSNLRQPSASACFSLSSDVAGTIEFRAAGNISVTLDGKEIYAAGADTAKKHVLNLPQSGRLVIHLQTEDAAQDIPALLPLNVVDGWRYSVDGKTESLPVKRPQRIDDLPPHLAELPQVLLSAYPVAENIWDAGAELLAYIDIEADEMPELFVGESIAEMENENPEDEEQTRELVQTGEHLWTSKVPLAFRYIRLKGSVGKISLRALFHPVEYKGAFAAEEQEDLTKIWMHSAYTLHLCMHHFLLDGIKRDRLPWAGDLAVSLMGNAYSFGDAELVKDSLSVLCANGIEKAHINDIADYSMWWIINHEFYQLYYNDPDFLELEYPRINETINILLSRRDSKGFLAQQHERDWFFIDWVPGDKITAVQILFVRALKAGAALAVRMQDHARAEELNAAADNQASVIRQECFCDTCKLFAEAPGSGNFSRHANLLAVVTGFADAETSSVIADALERKDLPPVGTPYMSVFEALALAKAGRFDAALRLIREIWGGMLALGATSFYEGFNPAETGKQHLVFYDRPFGKSLCHAWSAGPLFLIPQLIAGLEPAADGWKEFKVNPLPGVTCAVTVPTPYGLIEAEIENGVLLKLTAPAECKQVTVKE